MPNTGYSKRTGAFGGGRNSPGGILKPGLSVKSSMPTIHKDKQDGVVHDIQLYIEGGQTKAANSKGQTTPVEQPVIKPKTQSQMR